MLNWHLLTQVYYSRIISFNAERQAGKLGIPIFVVFGMTRPGIKLLPTVSVADALSTRLLICRFYVPGKINIGVFRCSIFVASQCVLLQAMQDL